MTNYKDILREVSKILDVPQKSIKGNSRYYPLPFARKLYCWLCLRATPSKVGDSTMTKIGDVIGIPQNSVWVNRRDIETYIYTGDKKYTPIIGEALMRIKQASLTDYMILYHPKVKYIEINDSLLILHPSQGYQSLLVKIGEDIKDKDVVVFERFVSFGVKVWMAENVDDAINVTKDYLV